MICIIHEVKLDVEINRYVNENVFEILSAKVVFYFIIIFF